MADGRLAEEDEDEETHEVLRADYEIGQIIRDHVIPRAVLFYTGEAADMDMPEPIYRVQLSEPLLPARTSPTKPDTHTAPQGQRSGRTSPAAVDMGVNRDLQQQIDQDRETRDQPNLLDAQAPRE